MKPESGSVSLPELCAECARRAERREVRLGHAVPNCPSAAELWRVVEIAKDISAGDRIIAHQANAYMHELERISDKWVNPEADVIGVRMQPVVEALIDDLRQELEGAFPDISMIFQKRANLRKSKQLMERSRYLRDSKQSWLNRVWNRVLNRSRSESRSRCCGRDFLTHQVTELMYSRIVSYLCEKRLLIPFAGLGTS